MRVLYLDCSSGAAGDMLLGALVDAGADRDYVTAQLSLLDLQGWELDFEETTRAGLRGLKATVSVDQEHERTYLQVRETITSAGLDVGVAELALDAFARLAEAEARVHGTEVDDARFHEGGATDAIVDVVASVAALQSLNVDRVIASPVAVGSGRARTAHGSLPVPAPATLEILARAQVPVFAGEGGELTTPTGAALLAVIADAFGDFPEMTPATTGYGAGSQEREVPNVLRAVVGKESESIDERIILETNLDDMAPELFPHVINRLLEAGADDAWVTPILMKKGRPAFTLSALASRDTEPAVARIFFTETTTLGLRTTPAGKRPLARDWILVEIEGIPVQVKIGRFEGRVTNIAPEYEDALAAARSSDMPLKDVYRMAIDAAQEQVRTSSP